MKKMLVVLMCFVFCLSSFPAQVLGEGTCTITVANTEFGQVFIDGMNKNGQTVTVPQGHTAEIGVAPNHGYEIGSVTIGGTTYSTDAQIPDRSDFSQSVTINDDINVSVEFRLIKHTVTTVAGPNGSVSPENPEVDHGSDVTFTITPSAGYMINELRVDGHVEHVNESSQITVYNVQNDITLEVTFAEIVTYTITTVAGPNGSVSPENPVVEHGSDVTFTITPDPGYIIDELRVDGRPERADESGEFTVFNVQQDMTLEVTFMQVVAHTITIPKPINGNVQIVGEDGFVPEGGITLTSNTRDVFSFFIFPAVEYITPTGYKGGYKLSRVYLKDRTGEEIDITYAFYYDEDAGKIRIDIETFFDYTLYFDFTEQLPSGVDMYYEDIAILSSEIGSLEDLKAAVKREYGLRGIYLTDEKFRLPVMPTITQMISTNGVAYKQTGVRLKPYYFRDIETIGINIYVVDEVTNLIFKVREKNTYQTENDIFITNGSDPLFGDVVFEFPSVENVLMWFHGPYDATLMPMNSEVASYFRPFKPLHWVSLRCMYSIPSPFYRAQFHVVNRAKQPEKELNWFPFTIIQEDALCMNVQATSDSGTQDTFTWNLDTYPHVTVSDATQEVFFGNDRVILEKPRDNIGDIASMTAAASNSPGYTFTNNPDGTITIDFLSDYYDKVTVPLTIVKQSGGTVQRNLIIHRVGLDIQAHNAADGNPSQTRNVWHGTQTGNQVDFTDGNRYKLTASYFIPDFGDELPYGLYVTRKYANGRIETQIIRQPMTNPYPAQADQFNHAKKMYIYNDGSSGWANIADYLIYAGPNAASAPVEVSVLVLKNAPAIGGLFGGVDYGSGTGVTWTKP